MTESEERLVEIIADTITKAVNECGGELDRGTANDYALHLLDELVAEGKRAAAVRRGALVGGAFTPARGLAV